jgi:small subunit ribosomal protein S21
MGLYKGGNVNTINNFKKKTMFLVIRRKDEDIESLIKRFRKKYSKSGLSRELHQRMFFEKPGDKKRRKKAHYIRNIKKEEQKALEKEEQYKKMIAKKRRREKNERIKRKSSQRQDHSKDIRRG